MTLSDALTIPTTPDALEQAAFDTGAHITLTAHEAEATVTTEGGVTLRLVAPLGGAA
ncbi:MAG TPA: hypothetical protein VFH56_11180 [Acidimicrobiales bacterium]|nr:hypothetical protein [Acidimicrobiales bacterium]